MSAETERINPPVLYASVWWVVGAGCLLAAVVLVVLVLRQRRQQPVPVGIDVESLREATLARIRRLVEQGRRTQGGHEAAGRTAAGLSSEVRRFLGTVSAHDLDFTTRTHWDRAAQRDPRLDDAVVLLGDLEDLVFRPGAHIDVEALGRRSTEVVSQWR